MTSHKADRRAGGRGDDLPATEADTPIIYPTHDCFTDALEYLSDRVIFAGLRIGVFRLVHAIALLPAGPEKDKPFAHAWVEEDTDGGTLAWQSGYLDGRRIRYAVEAAALRAELRIQAETRYSALQACFENQRSGTYGPWKPEYQALCRE